MRQQVLWWLVSLGALAVMLGCEPTKLEPTKSGERQSVYGKVLDRADQSACEQYLSQLNQASQMYHSDHEAFAPDLATVIQSSKLPPAELQNCKYSYNAQTGRVTLAK